MSFLLLTSLSQMSDDSGSGPGESPYIGKSRFRSNQYAIEHKVSSKQPSVAVHGSVSSSSRAVAKTLIQTSTKTGQPVVGSVGDVIDSSETLNLADLDQELEKKMRAAELRKIIRVLLVLL